MNGILKVCEAHQRVKLRPAEVKDIGQIRQVEKEYYGGFSCPESVLRQWITARSGNFVVAERGKNITGFIFFENLDKAKAPPFIHRAGRGKTGKVAYVSEVGIKDKTGGKTMQRLLEWLVEKAGKTGCKKIIWLTGKRRRHDKLESELLLRNGFVKNKRVPKWEASPGHFISDHWLWELSVGDGLDAAIRRAIGDFETVETAMSRIYIGKKKAIKLFNPADLKVVDLRTIKKRKEVSIKTVEMDKVYSPDFGTRVVSIVCKNGRCRIVKKLVDGASDYGIIMRRFDSTQMLNRLYRTGRATQKHARQIGRLLAGAHKKAETGKAIARTGFNLIAEGLDNFFAQVKKFIGNGISKKDYALIKSRHRQFIRDNVNLLEKRRDSGFVRKCHGDVHSGNMFVEGGRVKIFDPIVFRDEFNCLDVIHDFAFAYMDAMAHERPDLAELMRKEYLKKTNDHEGMERLLDFYVSYSAFIRGKVAAMESKTRKAKKYFWVSREYALKACAPTVKNKETLKSPK